jgi:DNA-binding protein H-NS
LSIDLSKLSASELAELITKATSLQDGKRAQELTSHCDLFVKQSKDAGYSLKEVIAELKKFGDGDEKIVSRPKGTSKRAGVKRVIKFRGPNGEEWAGGGLMPKWMTALVATGRKKEEFAV